MKGLKKKFALVLALIAVLATCGSALAEDGYIIIRNEGSDEVKATSSEEIAVALNPSEGNVREGSVIEVYGKVVIPYTNVKGDNFDFGNRSAFFVIDSDKVTVEGKTTDAALYPNTPTTTGNGNDQNFITVYGNDVTIKGVTIMPHQYQYDPEYPGGYNPTSQSTNKTIEVLGQNFTMDDCEVIPNDSTETPTEDGGSICLTGGTDGLVTVHILNSTFNKCCIFMNDTEPTDVITISGCTFDTPAEDTYFIGNNTWSDPPKLVMGTVNVNDCSFINIPSDYDQIILHRMEGTFNLSGNTVTMADGSSASMVDMVAFSNKVQGDAVTTTPSDTYIVNVTEDGKVYEITPQKNADGTYTPAVEDVTPDVAAPVADPKTGTYTEAQTVTLTAEDGAAVIYYTTDGTNPTEASTLYSGAFTIDKTTTLKAIAVVDGAYSAVMTEVYTFQTNSSGSGGGCSAGFGALALLAAVPLMFRRKK